MRMRNPKNKDEILASCNFYLDESLFGNNNPLHLEIGMGKGDFILNMALKFPNINFIGVEKYASVACVAIKKIKEYELPNLKVMILDACDLPEYLHGKIETIYLNFSDPWPKARHEKRRLTHENYLKVYDTLFKDRCHLIMKTDNDDLFAFSVESLRNYGYNVLDICYDLHSTNISNVMTEYERKFSSQGVKIKYLNVEKDNK
ncbi:MAG: tRNA (guanosine(46)-N7)-methyltransferase TrmB [Firmicutes bacterium]|nr:tRNA (guanosine(46)-N7)-methyltransferase TrmB [Bacillota bacterium]